MWEPKSQQNDFPTIFIIKVHLYTSYSDIYIYYENCKRKRGPGYYNLNFRGYMMNADVLLCSPVVMTLLKFNFVLYIYLLKEFSPVCFIILLFNKLMKNKVLSKHFFLPFNKSWHLWGKLLQIRLFPQYVERGYYYIFSFIRIEYNTLPYMHNTHST